MVLTIPMVLTKTYGIESVLLNHTRTRGPSVTHVRDFFCKYHVTPWCSFGSVVGGQGHFWKLLKRKHPFFTERLPLAKNILKKSAENTQLLVYFLYISSPV